MEKTKEKDKKCPICGRKSLMVSFQSHLIKAAHSEMIEAMKELLRKSDGKQTTFSPQALMKKYKHINFYYSHLVKVEKYVFKLHL